MLLNASANPIGDIEMPCLEKAKLHAQDSWHSLPPVCSLQHLATESIYSNIWLQRAFTGMAIHIFVVVVVDALTFPARTND